MNSSPTSAGPGFAAGQVWTVAARAEFVGHGFAALRLFLGVDAAQTLTLGSRACRLPSFAA